MAEALKEILTSRNLDSTERNRRNEDNGPHLEVLYVLVFPHPFLMPASVPYFYLRKKLSNLGLIRTTVGVKKMRLIWNLGETKGAFLPALHYAYLAYVQVPQQRFLWTIIMSRGIGYCQRRHVEAIMIGFGKRDAIDQFMANY